MATITLIGAGSAVFAQRLLVDILSTPALAGSEIRLTDIDPVRLSTAEAMVRQVAAQLGGGATVTATLDRRQALAGAGYVINAIQVGGHAATLLDFNIPRKYGLKQTIADTLGVGGVFRTLRTLPVLLQICRDMEELCPGALLLNYTNPMAMLMLAVGRATGIKGVGLCHSIQHTSRLLAKYCNLPYEEISFRAAGINHMAWFTEFRHQGADAYPLLWQAMADAEVYATNKVRFELFRRLGYFMTESSEHLSEYVPYFLKRDDLIKRFEIPVDEYIRRSERNLRRFQEVRAKVDAGEAFELVASNEYAAPIIAAMETGVPFVFYGNVMNTQLITNLPPDSCVEVPCLVDHAGVQPTHFGALPPELAALNRTNIHVQQLTVEAALTGNRDHVYHAVMLDPHAASTLSLDEIWAMTDELIEAHGPALPPLRSRRLH